MSQEVYTITQALEKAMKYCAYQERSQFEVRIKLNTFQLTSHQVEEVICDLISQDFLNEERFAKAFSRGKFRIKHWGKKKIESALLQKQIHPHCIKLGLKEIDEHEYLEVLQELALKTWAKNRKLSAFQRMGKSGQYLISRGYDSQEVWRILKSYEND